MGHVTARVEHSLGAAEAERRLRKAAEELQESKHGALVRSLAWNTGVATVEGKGFEGTLTVREAEVVVEAELGLPASLFPMKAKREAEEWLKRLLA